jgi:hypothetical protein
VSDKKVRRVRRDLGAVADPTEGLTSGDEGDGGPEDLLSGS